MAQSSCPARDKLRAFVLGTVDASQLDILAEHIEHCPTCQTAVDDLESVPSALVQRVKVALRSPGDPIDEACARMLLRAEAIDQHAIEPARVFEVEGYEIIQLIGRGGMGAVYKARDKRLNRLVALKMILSGDLADDSDLSRFYGEAEAIARLRHPNIVQIHEVGSREQRPYLSLELVEGGSLADLVGEPLPARTAAGILEPVARGIGYAHAQGIVHRDLKPANILLEPQEHSGSSIETWPDASSPTAWPGAATETEIDDIESPVPKIADFGLAKFIGSDDQRTRTGAILGTPQFMAPEQATGRSERIGPSADIYALGAILYALLVGRPPLQGDTAAETIRMLADEEPVSPTLLQPRIPRDLETICLKCLEKEPSKRYHNAEIVADELKRFLGGLPIQARPVGSFERSIKWVKRKPAVATLTSIVILVAIAGLGGIVSQWRTAELARANAETRATAELRARRSEAVERSKAEYALEKAETNMYYSYIAQAELQYAANKVDHARRALDLCRPRQDRPDRRGWEWGYLYGLTHSALRTFPVGTNNGMWVFAVAISPDGHWLATGAGVPHYTTIPLDAAGSLQIWDVESGQLVKDLTDRARTLGIRYVAFSSDGKRLVTSEMNWRTFEQRRFGPIRIWDLESGNELCRMESGSTRETGTYMPGFSPDGSLILASPWIAHLKVWDGETGDLRYILDGQRNYRFTSGGKKIITIGVDGSRSLWDAQTGSLIQALSETKKPGGPLIPSNWSSDDRYIATASLPEVKIRDAKSMEPVTALTSLSSPIRSMTVSPDSRFLTIGCQDSTIQFWRMERAGRGTLAQRHATLRGHNGPVTKLRFSANGRLIASASGDGTAKLWVAQHPEFTSLSPPIQVKQHSLSFVGDLAFRPDSREIVGVTLPGGELHKWNSTTSEYLSGRTVPIGGRLLVRFDSEAKLLLAPDPASQAVLNVWDVDTGNKVARLEHEQDVQFADFSLSGQRVISLALDAGSPLGHDVEWTIWDLPSHRKLFRHSEPWSGHRVRAAADANAQSLVVADTVVRVWDVAEQTELFNLGRSKSTIMALGVNADGRLVAWATVTGRVILWNRTTNSRVELSADEAVYDLRFSPDSSRLVAATRRALFIWDTTTGHEVITLRGPEPNYDAPFRARVKFSPDGNLIAANQWDDSIRVWNGSRNTNRRAPLGSDRATATWHRQSALHCQSQEHWSAALFHWDQLIRHDPGDLTAQLHRTGTLWLADNRSEAKHAREQLLDAVDSGFPLTGAGEYFSAPHIPFDAYEGFTVEAWVKGWNYSVLSQGSANDRDNAVWVGISKHGIGWSSPPGMRATLAVHAVPLPDWTHLALVFDGIRQLVFVNGQLHQATAAAKPGPIDRSRPFLIGRFPEGGTRGVGLVRSVRVSKTDRYKSDFVPRQSWKPDTDTIVLFNFDQLDGATLLDLSGKGNHATLHNVWWSDQ